MSLEGLTHPVDHGASGHGHHHNGAPLLALNETEILLYHAPTPPSYYTIDWDDTDGSETRHPSLIITHVIFMSLAFFVALPIGRSSNILSPALLF